MSMLFINILIIPRRWLGYSNIGYECGRMKERNVIVIFMDDDDDCILNFEHQS